MVAAPDASPVGIFLKPDAPLGYLLGKVRQLSRESGEPAYLVGGPVRDGLLGVPIKDLDVSVVGDAPAMAARLADLVGGRLTVHRRFGTATVETRDGAVDLVTARHETYPRPGALPVVSPGSISDDLTRRDFTVNAMAIPLDGDPARIVDLHGGQDDLRSGVVRILHDESFQDDPTRMLRAARYAARFDFKIAADSTRAMRAALPGAMSTISGDRVRHELERIFQEDRPLPALRLAGDLRILAAIHPSLAVPHLDNFVAHDLSLAPHVWLSGLVWNLRPDEGSAFARRVSAPSDWVRVIDDTATLSSRIDRLVEPWMPPSSVCALLDGLAPDCLQAARLLAPPAVSERIGRYWDEWWSIAPLLRGSDLLELGIPPGPAVGEALRALRKARLDGETRTREDELSFAQHWAPP